MTVRAAIVIPIYNHKDEIGTTLERLMPHGLPIFVVDDGSNDATKAVLAELAERWSPSVSLLRRPVNGGKGAAVMDGLKAAHEAGFTHALQIDADGQHDAADVPRFLDAARAAPDALVLGRPVYDDSVPKARLYGRYLTHIWVWIETLSFAIPDSMCGFRLYPLDAACALIDSVALPTRMDFDIEILVRLSWRALRFVTIATRVTYAPGGLSHFDVVRDNVRISKSHTRLVVGMLARLPLLLARKVLPRKGESKPAPTPKPKGDAKGEGDSHSNERRGWWRIAERGSRTGMRLLALSCRLFGMRATRLWLHPIVAYFVLTGRAARLESLRYFERLREASPAQTTPTPGWRSAYRQMFAFADAGLDKLAAWTGRIDRARIAFDDPSAFEALVASGKGALVIGAHLGNLEMTRALAVRGSRAKVTAVVYTEHARRFTSVLSGAHRDFASRMVEVTDFGPETAVLMQQRIDAGEMLVIVGDRVPAHEAGRVVDVPFLGRAAPFAQGPYVLAHALGCPVYLFFCLKERGVHRVYFEPFAERIALPRRERAVHLADHARRYAARLEYYCRKAPYQWFNFFDFWARQSQSQRGEGNGRR
ncbi:glycosyltransferase family 2 protein [Trinickia dinghuensis]|uniref:Glycosyltransferase family 2 protein n=1 Tax=Trinickia dinghuensis TaxID=2291023 RepID=A0A3D8JSG2_9BURK|nr:glycosyltransferase family 2 protein [Trinickia dinghuensis]RDU95675.1 glycosyltransferase family 2 protein [Trinickia dinghuensis]